MHCLILAAGYATRLSPLTDNFPKPLLDVRGKSILDWMLDDLEANADIRQYVVVSNHKYAEHFRNWAQRRPGRVTVVDDGTCTNETRLGAVRDIQCAMDAVPMDDDVLVAAGDNLLTFSLSTLIAYFRGKGASCVMRYNEPDAVKLTKCGVITVDEQDRVVSMVEKSPNPPSHWVVPPFYCYTAADIALVRQALADGCNADAPGSYVAWLAAHRAVYAMPMPGERMDVGNLESYRRCCETFRG